MDVATFESYRLNVKESISAMSFQTSTEANTTTSKTVEGMKDAITGTMEAFGRLEIRGIEISGNINEIQQRFEEGDTKMKRVLEAPIEIMQSKK